jgi:uracil-DNA glycosylase
MSLKRLLRDVRACRTCAASLPLGPRPVLCLARSARLLIIGQAPGRRAHDSGVPWNDASGVRLRDWMMIDVEDFYDESRIAVLPMGFCYPGAGESGGDKPPRPECTQLWHGRLLNYLPNLRLTLLVGQYAQRHYLGSRRKGSMTETVRAFSEYGPRIFPLPHPSWRSRFWMQKNPWFEKVVLRELRKAVHSQLDLRPRTT